MVGIKEKVTDFNFEKMRARATSHIDWWHARQTAVSLDFNVSVFIRSLGVDFLECKIINIELSGYWFKIS